MHWVARVKPHHQGTVAVFSRPWKRQSETAACNLSSNLHPAPSIEAVGSSQVFRVNPSPWSDSAVLSQKPRPPLSGIVAAARGLQSFRHRSRMITEFLFRTDFLKSGAKSAPPAPSNKNIAEHCLIQSPRARETGRKGCGVVYCDRS